MSLRARLTLAFTAIAAAAVLASGLGMIALVEHAVWDPLDAALSEEAEHLAWTRDVASPGELAAAAAQVAGESKPGPGKFVRVIGPDGRAITSIPADASDLELGRPLPGATTSATVEHAPGLSRVVRYGAPGGGWVDIGVHAAREVRLLNRARLGIGLAAIGLLTLLGGLVWRIATRATAELERLTDELERIEAGSLDRRLQPRRTSEVNRTVAVLNRLLARLEVAMNHLKRFTADAAHELRTPVAALRAHVEVTLARARSAVDYRDGLLDALEQTERLGRLAEDLLVLSAVDAGAVATAEATVALDALVRDAVESLEPIAHEQGRTLTCRAPDPIAVRGSGELLKRVVLNLVDNALRHTPPTAAVDVALGRQNGAAVIEVRDAGPGIAAAEQAKVFERFHRQGRAGGTGLGLALCREIVLRHGGEIGLRSVPAEGTTFTVTLPLARA